MSINLIYLHKICENSKLMASMLQQWHLIPEEGVYMCPECGGQLKLYADALRSDGLRWHCNNMVSKRKQKRKMCRKLIEFRSGTFFARSKLSMFQILGFVNLWISNVHFKVIQEQLEISYQSYLSWFCYCNEVILDYFIMNKEKLGGLGRLVEIDGANFGNRKYSHVNYQENHCTLGVYECGTGRALMIVVDKIDSDVLLSIIRDWIEPGTTILSDLTEKHDFFKHEAYEELKTSNNLEFLESDRDMHRHLFKISGYKEIPIADNLAKYMFYKRCAELNLNYTLEFYRFAGQMFNPLNTLVEVEIYEKYDDDLLDPLFH